MMRAERKSGKIDLTGWHFDLGEYLKSDLVLAHMAEAIENSLEIEPPSVSIGWNDKDLTLYLHLFAFGDNSPEYTVSLTDIVQDEILKNGDLRNDEDTEEAIELRDALLALAQRITDTIDDWTSKKAG